MFPQSLHMTARLAMLLLGQRSLRNEGSEASIISFIGQLCQLLVGDREVVTTRTELLAHGSELALDLGAGHENSLGRERDVSSSLCFGHCCEVSRALLISISLAVIAGGCSASGDSAGCTELREAEDQQSGRHVLSDEGLTYLTDPPTSGPHASGASPTGVLDTALPAPIQVRILEGAGVVVQYDGGASDAEIADLAAIAGDTIVVAPGGEDLPAPFVATAWTWKLTCDGADIDRIMEFAEQRRIDSPGFD